MPTTKRKHILVTGATGFIGSHLLARLVRDTVYDVSILKRSTSDTWRINSQLASVSIFDWDKCDLAAVFEENSFDLVIHLAAKYIKVHKTSEDVTQMVATNISMPTDLMQLCILHNVKHFINTGTFFEYKMKDSPINEKDPISPYNFYAATKCAFNDLLKYFASNMGLNVLDLKLFAPFGEKDNEKLFAFLTKSLLSGTHIDFSGGEQRWNFTYVLDIVEAYICGINLMLNGNFQGFESVNIGSTDTFSLKEVVSCMERTAGMKMDITFGAKPYALDEIFYACSDIRKAESLLKWHPQYRLDQGITEILKFYKER